MVTNPLCIGRSPMLAVPYLPLWRFRRLLKASYGHVQRLVAWWGQEAFNTVPPPSNGVL